MGLLSNRESVGSEGFGFFPVPSLQGQTRKSGQTQSRDDWSSDPASQGKRETVVKLTMDLVVKKPDFVRMRKAAIAAKRRSMFKMAGYLRRGGMNQFVKPKKDVSKPNGKPVQHVPTYFSAKNILFSVSSTGDYAVIGSVKLTKRRKDVKQSQPASGVLEHGGRVRFIEGQYRLPDGRKTWRRVSKKEKGKLLRQRSRTVKIAARPYMSRALNKALEKGVLITAWRDSFGRSG